MDDMDTGSNSASGSENRELSEDEVAPSPPPMSDLVRKYDLFNVDPKSFQISTCNKK